MATTTQRPVDTVRYRNIKASIWQNEGDNGTHYSITLTRSYRTANGGWKDTRSLSALDALVAAEALREAAGRIRELESQARAQQAAQGGAL